MAELLCDLTGQRAKMRIGRVSRQRFSAELGSKVLPVAFTHELNAFEHAGTVTNLGSGAFSHARGGCVVPALATQQLGKQAAGISFHFAGQKEPELGFRPIDSPACHNACASQKRNRVSVGCWRSPKSSKAAANSG